MSIDTLGLREQKKRETRQAISDHATQLFLERGFDRTTIADIAAAARVAKMTVTNYFPRKEDLALDHHEAFVAGLAEVVAGRTPGESALGAVRRAYLSALERRDPVIGFTGRDFARMVADSPTLTARLRDLHDQREDALTAQLTTELPTTAPPSHQPSPNTEPSSHEAALPSAPSHEAAHPTGPSSHEVPPTPAPGTTDVIGSATPHGAAAEGAATPPVGARVEAARLTARAVAAQLAAADRLLFRELQRRTLAGESDAAIAAALDEIARHVFGLLEPAIGEYARR